MLLSPAIAFYMGKICVSTLLVGWCSRTDSYIGRRMRIKVFRVVSSETCWRCMSSNTPGGTRSRYFRSTVKIVNFGRTPVPAFEGMPLDTVSPVVLRGRRNPFLSLPIVNPNCRAYVVNEEVRGFRVLEVDWTFAMPGYCESMFLRDCLTQEDSLR